MAGASDTEVLVIGGGAIGLTIALRLADDGRAVTLLEPNEPGSGASYGNAGTIAEYAIIPVGTPGVLRNLPDLLFSRVSPLSVRKAALPTLFPWLLRFAYESLPGPMRRNVAALAPLLAEAAGGWHELSAQIGAEDLFRHNGCVYAYTSMRDFKAAEADITLRGTYGIAQELLSSDALSRLEPQLPPFEGGAVLFPGAMSMTDPGEAMRRLAVAVTQAGVRILLRRAIRLERQSAGVRVTTPEGAITARRVVIAAGAHSKALVAQAGERVPLDTERGYHIEFDMPTPLLSRPVSPTSRGFYMVPMQGRLRIAGLVELGDLAAPANERRFAQLEEGARTFFPDLGKPDRSWLGFRPSMPNSVPVIRPVRGARDVILAFGHGHLGLTLAPVTARIVRDLVAGRAPVN